MKPYRNFHALTLACCWAALFAGIQIAHAQTPPPMPAVDQTPQKVKIDGGELYVLGFDKLSAFPYTIVDSGTGATAEEIKVAQTRDQIPAWIRLYHGQRVVLTGYMMPLLIENGLSKKFVMMRDVNTCCYGSVPNMNDYAVVTMKGAGIAVVQDVPVELIGTFRIDEKYEGGYVVSLFVIDGEKFIGAKK